MVAYRIQQGSDVMLDSVDDPAMDLSDSKGEPSLPFSETSEDDFTVSLTPEEEGEVDTLATSLDMTNVSDVLDYGSEPQRKMADFSEQALAEVRTKDLGEIGSDIASLMVTLQDFDPTEEDHSILGLFKRGKGQAEALKARYSEVEKNVSHLADVLEGHKRTLLDDISMLDEMYAANEAYFEELTLYIAAGKRKLAEARAAELPTLEAKAARTGRAEDSQAVRDLVQMCDRLEKRVYDLELTRQIALQTAPQIRLMQSSDAVMAEKIQSTVVNTIPLWKNQMVIALGLEHATQAARAQREVTNMTNSLLRKNAERLKTAAVDTAREAERGIVEMETLRHTNERLIATLNEIARIQSEGRESRREAEDELSQIEDELKTKLVDVSQG